MNDADNAMPRLAWLIRGVTPAEMEALCVALARQAVAVQCQGYGAPEEAASLVLDGVLPPIARRIGAARALAGPEDAEAVLTQAMGRRGRARAAACAELRG
jgi:hypothetical protein